jgi:hypothetical protein
MEDGVRSGSQCHKVNVQNRLLNSAACLLVSPTLHDLASEEVRYSRIEMLEISPGHMTTILLSIAESGLRRTKEPYCGYWLHATQNCTLTF